MCQTFLIRTPLILSMWLANTLLHQSFYPLLTNHSSLNHHLSWEQVRRHRQMFNTLIRTMNDRHRRGDVVDPTEQWRFNRPWILSSESGLYIERYPPPLPPHLPQL